MAKVLQRPIHVEDKLQTSIMRVPVGPSPQGQNELSFVESGAPYDYLYICTGILGFDFRPNNGWIYGTLTEHGDQEPRSVPIYYSDGVTRLSIISPTTRRPYKIISQSVTASVAGFNNLGDDNGGWVVDEATVLDPSDNAGEPELNITIGVRGADGIHFQRVSYVAIFQVSVIT